MNNFEFCIPTRIIFGTDADQKVGELAAAYGKTALILYGSERICENGLMDQVKESLKNAGVYSVTYGGIRENPTLEIAEQICVFAKEIGADLLLAIGGGSVIDTAKAVSIGVHYEGSIWDFYEQKAQPIQALPIGVILTMAATASEANCLSVLSNEKINKKSLFGHPLLYPKFSLLNPELTYTVPKKQTAIGAIDIFAHAFERYFHKEQRCTLRLELCAAVMKTIIQELPNALLYEGNYDARSQIMWAATMAHSDMIGTDGVFAVHEMSHVLTEAYGIPHGMAVGILMLAWSAYLIPSDPEPFAEFAKQVWNVNGAGKTDVEVAKEGLRNFREFISQNLLPTSLSVAGIEDVDSEMLMKKTLEFVPSLGDAFYPLYEKEIQTIYELAK